jgi:asparagine synthase (glutamine-hydrolysing)
MCGIMGIVSLNNKKVKKCKERIGKMVELMHHRGPDDNGMFVSDDGLVAFGHTRLSIVDPTSKINQPLVSVKQGSCITFNGEVYNHNKLRKNLEMGGTTFTSHTDTEVLFEGLNSYGADYINKLDGMWAFAYYSKIKNSVILSRDLLGERPLFYYSDEDEFIFSSEIKPILEVALKKFKLDNNSVENSILFCSAPPGKTIVQGVYRLNSGNIIEINIGKGFQESNRLKLHPEKWFDYFANNPSEDDIVSKYEELLTEAILDRIPTEVSYYMTLSGGIDSTLNTIFASKEGCEVDTLYGQSADNSPKIDSDEYSERDAAIFTSRRLGTNHTEMHMANKESINILQEDSRNGFDGIFDSATASFTMLADQAKRDGKKVVIISDGPDEVFGGYDVDLAAHKLDNLYNFNKYLFSLLKKMSKILPDKLFNIIFKNRHYKIYDIFSYSPFRFKPIHYALSKKHLEKLLNKNIDINNKYGTIPEKYRNILSSLDSTQKRALSYACYSLPDVFNMRTDKAFYSKSIEVRVPHQSVKLIEFGIALPTKYRFKDSKISKYIPRKVVEKHLGKKISNRSKYGFVAPIFRNKKIYKQLDFKTFFANNKAEIKILKDNDFVKEVLNNKKYFKFEWPLYVLINTYKELLRINNAKK